ncbi:hypothetical protein EG68_01472 [Paragonimus skrjabini miyazakii]|uniref:Uncharacterized protein n=1 Tax=Paragonimus skrjabini miyazakii TaxID=59628 RepID=A0A8S9ZBW8_9TREM|nr:hypothetical protein EG68_01472 [Paragonimus skrjabini miyazakii]
MLHALYTLGCFSLVAFTVQIETVNGNVVSHRLVSLDTLFSPVNELIGICFSTLGMLIPLIILIDRGFNYLVSRPTGIRALT